MRALQCLRGSDQAVAHPGCMPPYSFGLAELPSLLSLRLCGGYDGLGFIASDGLLPSFPMMG